MNSQLCNDLGIEFPLFAFSHCRDVVAAVSKAGGMGVFGAVMYTPEQLRQELRWIEDHVDGKPYGVDLIVPNSISAHGSQLEPEKLLAALPQEQINFVNETLSGFGVDTSSLDELRRHHLSFAKNMSAEGADEMLEVAFSFPIRLIANALGQPPEIMLQMGREKGVPVAALVGSKKHAQAQLEAGVDVLVAAGGEAGGHCGEISTMVLVPEVVSIAGNVPVLAAGGIVTGEQMAAAMAMGAAGAWCGSVWLTTAEAEPSEFIKQRMLDASSSDTVRSKSRTGKYSRQLKSAWTQAWAQSDVATLPMPFQSIVAEPAMELVNKLTANDHEGAKQIASYWVGQGVGLMNEATSSAAVVQDFKEGYLRAIDRLNGTVSD